MLGTFFGREVVRYRRLFGLILLSMTISLSVFAIVNSFVAGVTDSIQSQVKPYLGWDLSIEWNSVLTTGQLASISGLHEQYGVLLSQTLSLSTTLTDVRDQTPKLITLMGVDANYPFYGDYSYKAVGNGTGSAGAIVSQSVYDSLVSGNTIALGTKIVPVKGIITALPGQSLDLLSDGREVVVPFDFAQTLDLTDFGARVSYKYLLKVPKQSDVVTVKDGVRGDVNFKGVRVTTAEQSLDRIGSLTDDFLLYVNAILVIALVLACISIYFVIESYFQQRAKTYGILKILGVTQWQLVWTLSLVFLGVFVVSAGLAIVIAHLVLGNITIQGITIVLGLTQPLIITTLSVGLLITLVSVSLPLYQFTIKTPLESIKQGALDLLNTRNAVVQIGLVFGFIFVLFVIIGTVWTKALRLGALITIGLLVILGLIYLLMLLITDVAKVFKKSNFLLFDSIRHLLRPGSIDLVATTALRITTTALFVTGFLSLGFVKQLDSLNTTQPNLYVLNIISSDIPALKKVLTGDELYSTILARISSINGVSLTDHLGQEPGPDQGREFRATTNTLTDNTYVSGHAPSTGEVSVGQSTATDMGIKVGDTVTFSIAGRDLDLKVSGIRTWQTSSISPFFYFQFYGPDFRDAPITYFIVTRVPTEQLTGYEQKILAATGPHINFIDIGAIAATVSEVWGQLLQAVLFLLGVMTFFAVLVTISTIVRSKDLMKTRMEVYYELGATEAQQRKLFVYQQSAVTGIAIIFAIIVGTAAVLWTLSIASVLVWSWGVFGETVGAILVLGLVQLGIVMRGR